MSLIGLSPLIAAWVFAAAVPPPGAITTDSAGPLPGLPMIGAAASPGHHGVLAAWTDDEVFLSEDDGRTFSRVLRGRGKVRAVALNDAGDLFVARADRHEHVALGGRGALLVRAAGGGESASSLPEGMPRSIFVGGATVGVVLDREGEVFALSHDAGRTFQDEAASIGNAGFSAIVAPDGSIDAMTGYEAACGGGGQARERRDPVTGEWTALAWGLDAPFDWGLGANGFAYGVDECGPGEHDARCVIAVGASPKAVLRLPPLAAWASLQVSTNGRDTFALYGPYLIDLDGERGRVVDTRAPSDTWIASVDSDGRVLGLADGSVLRWSREEGWRPLAGGGDLAD